MNQEDKQDQVVQSDKALIRAEREEARKSAELAQRKAKQADRLKFLIAIALVVAGVWAYYSVSGFPSYINALFPVIGVLAALAVVFFWSGIGSNLLAYVRQSFAEVKKVVWPDKASAAKTTVFVVIFVAVFAVFIYAADSLISWLFNLVLVKG